MKDLLRKKDSGLTINARLEKTTDPKLGLVQFMAIWYKDGIVKPENRQRKAVNTGVKVKKVWFNSTPKVKNDLPQWVKNSEPQNVQLKETWDKINRLYDNTYSAAQFSEVWKNPEAAETLEVKGDFWTAWERYLKRHSKNKMNNVNAFRSWRNWSEAREVTLTWSSFKESKVIELYLDDVYWFDSLNAELIEKMFFQKNRKTGLSGQVVKTYIARLNDFLEWAYLEYDAPKYVTEIVKSLRVKRLLKDIPTHAEKTAVLGPEEIEELYNFKFSNQVTSANQGHVMSEQEAVNLFLIACFDGARWSDLRKIKGGLMPDFEQKNTGGDTKKRFRIRELSPETHLILNERFGGELPATLPPYFTTNFQTLLRGAFKQMSWGQDEVLETQTQAGRKDTAQAKVKYKALSFHSGRRSWATNEFERGTPIELISAKMNHQKIQTTIDYIKAKAKTEASRWAAIYSDRRKGLMKVSQSVAS